MKRLTNLAIVLFAFGIAIPAYGDDQQKAERQIHKVAAMATDATGRRVVSITVADTLAAKRSDLVLERRALNLNYGDLFLAHMLVKSGARMQDIDTELKAGKKLVQIANAQHADWKQLLAEAKKLNATMEDNLYKHFVNGQADAARDAEDGYDPMIDGVAADNDVPKDDIADAEHTYQVWKDRAAKAKDSKLDSATEKAAQGVRGDPVKAKAAAMHQPK
jgi:hypothetical protein